jgi:hypothetical protein
MMQSQFVNQGIPVLLGEWRAEPKPSEPDLTGSNIELNYDSVTYWDVFVHDCANSHGMYCACWDTPEQLFDWTTGDILDQTQIDALLGKSAVPPPGSYLIDNGAYKIVQAQSGKAVEDPGGSKASGAQMEIWTKTGGANQMWTLFNIGNNVVELINNCSYMALEVQSGATNSGAAVDQAPYTGATNQQWAVVPATSRAYNLVNVNSGLVLDIAGSASVNGAVLDQSSSTGSKNQQWIFR